MKRVFIANRGEIAVRIVRACRELGLECVVGVSDADRGGLAARLADQSICIGPAPAGDSYLRDDLVVQAALGTGCDAIHPGYGFLAESARLAGRALSAGLVFVGPPPEVIELTGDKLRAREQALLAGLPVLGGHAVESVGAALALADEIGYPVLLKAAAGGGGRGIKLVREPAELPGLLSLARAEAQAAFDDDRVYVERLIANARHIEVQIAADQQGQVVHLGERDCSVQRRYQKLIEEAPAPALAGSVRDAIRDSAVTLARALRYRNLGTVEFVLDADSDELFFLELNCRIQVEHPVTEALTGRDLVALQLRIAAGEPLGFEQSRVTFAGHAIECRLCAEDPGHGFRPSPGTLSAFAIPEIAGLRVDTHCEPGAVIPPYYDSLMAKLIAHAEDREHAVALLLEVLDELEVEGVECNRGFLAEVLHHPGFRAGAVTTDWLGGRWHERWAHGRRGPGPRDRRRGSSRRGRVIGFVDTSIRDGNQSLWSATGLRTPDVLGIAPVLDRVGYHALDFTSSTHMAVSVRFHREDPWERLRLVSAAMPDTPLGMIGTGMRFISWVPAAEDLMALSFRVAVRNGLRRFQIADPSNDPARIRRIAALARREGIEEVVVGLTYSISPVHTHAYYAEHAAALADCAEIDRLYLKDPGGLLTPDAVRELAPHFIAAARGRAVELHSHCTIGLAPLVYVEGVRAGFQLVHTASGPLSRGTSQPEVLNTAGNLEAAGFAHALDLEAQAAVSAHFQRLAADRGLPAGAPQEFDGAYYRHQLPGGMVTTTQRMLAEVRRPELYQQVLEEVTRVRAEMGYPIIVTPVSQFIASQAARNVIDGERWRSVSDETIRYFWGHYGEPPAPVDQAVAERVLSRPQAAKLRALEPIGLEGARRRFGAWISEEELLLRLTMPAEQVDAMIAERDGRSPAPASGPAPAGRRPGSERAAPPPAPAAAAPAAAAPAAALAPVVQLLQGLEARPQVRELTLTAGDESVVWRRD